MTGADDQVADYSLAGPLPAPGAGRYLLAGSLIERLLMDQPVLVLVEDEPMMLLHAQDALEDGGYRVLEAADGEAALTLLSDRLDAVLGLVTDVQLGEGISGWEVARRARELKPSIPVVYVTAESPDDWAAQGVPKSILVSKPYATAQILTAISTLINEADRSVGA